MPPSAREAVSGAVAPPAVRVRFWSALGDLASLVMRSNAPGLRWRVSLALTFTLVGKALGVLAPLLLGAAVSALFANDGTALKALDAEFEAVSASLKVPFWTTFVRVTLPICTPALLDIARYFFVNAMTTISAVVFLYSPETKVASIAILNLDEAGEIGAAAACAVMIAVASTVATTLFWLLSRWIERRTQAWKAES